MLCYELIFFILLLFAKYVDKPNNHILLKT